MKKERIAAVAAALLMLCGCAGKEEGVSTTAPPEPVRRVRPRPVAEVREALSDEDYIRRVYPDQLRRYYTALLEQWPEPLYREQGLSPLGAAYAQGDPLVNVGFALADLDGDGFRELIIGAIRGSEDDPAIFEVWTAPKEEPRRLLSSDSAKIFYLTRTPGGGTAFLCREGTAWSLLRPEGEEVRQLWCLRPGAETALLESPFLPAPLPLRSGDFAAGLRETVLRVKLYPFYLYTP